MVAFTCIDYGKGLQRGLPSSRALEVSCADNKVAWPTGMHVGDLPAKYLIPQNRTAQNMDIHLVALFSRCRAA
eukprot:scaffold103855_cov17-Tisochrysis_lutea.AAC.1